MFEIVDLVRFSLKTVLRHFKCLELATRILITEFRGASFRLCNLVLTLPQRTEGAFVVWLVLVAVWLTLLPPRYAKDLSDPLVDRTSVGLHLVTEAASSSRRLRIFCLFLFFFLENSGF